MSIIGVLGKLMKLAAIPAGFANPLIGAGLGAAGGIADRSDDEGGLGKMKLFNDVLAPAGLAYGGGKLAGLMRGAGGGGAMMDAVGPTGLGEVVKPVADVASLARRTAPSLGNVASSIGKFAGKNPDLLLRGAGMGLNYMGSREEIEREKRARAIQAQALGQWLPQLMRGVGQ